jgi:uncharacterized protein DUF5107
MAVPCRSPSQEPDSVTLGNRPRTGCDTMQVQVIDGAGGAVTVLDIRSIVLSAPRRGSVNPLPPLRLLGDLHDEIDCTGLDAEMARNIRKGTVRSVLPYLLQDDYSRELVPQETSVATLENDYLLATVLLEFGGRLWSLQDKVGGRELLYNNDRIQFGNLGLRNAWFPGQSRVEPGNHRAYEIDMFACARSFPRVPRWRSRPSYLRVGADAGPCVPAGLQAGTQVAAPCGRYQGDQPECTCRAGLLVVEHRARELPWHSGRGAQPDRVRVHLCATAPSCSRAGVRSGRPHLSACGLEIADLREGEVSLSDLWLTVHRAPPGQADVPFIYDFRLHGAAAGT